MLDHDKAEFAQLLQSVHDLYGKDMTPFVIGVWWEAMKPYDLPAVRQAFTRHAMNPDTGQFAPKPADVVRMMGGTTQDAALVAWAKVDRAVKHVGPHRTVAFDDPLIHRVVDDMGGWVWLNAQTEKEWPFVAKQFENRYRGFAMRGEIPPHPATLIGICEATNGVRGLLPTEPPTMIGDASAAAMVMKTGGAGAIGFKATQAPPSLLASIELGITEHLAPNSAKRVTHEQGGEACRSLN